MKRMVRLVLLLACVVAVAGCSLEDGQLAFWSSPRGSNLESVRYRVVLEPDGRLRVRMAAEFLDDDGGTLPIPEPLLGGIEDLTVDGRPASGSNVPVDGRQAVATFRITGGVTSGDDITIIDTPLVASPSDASRQDPPVAVEGVLVLPEGTPASAIDFHWINGLDQDVAVQQAKVRFSGESPLWTSSDLLVGLPPGLAPGAGGGFAASQAAFATEVSTATANSESLESTLDSQETTERLITWAIVGVSVGLSLFFLFQWYRTQSADRRDREKFMAKFPQHLAEPPDEHDPAVVGLLVDAAKRLDQDAVAGTVLDLAHRRVITIDGYGPDRWVLRVPSDARGRNASEQIVLDALRAQAPNGEITGPPLWADTSPRWWRAYRADVFKRAKDAGLIRRRFRLLYVGPFAAGIVGASWPLWANQDQIWIVPVAVIALGMVFALPLGGGFEPTMAGVRSLGKWLAFGRYTADQGHWEDVGPPGIAVWGPYLSYGTVLGTCPWATAQLAPKGGFERARRSEAQDQVDAEEAASEGAVTP